MTRTSEAGDVLFSVYNPAHRWYYAPQLANDEVLIFKCFESEPHGRAPYTLHSASEHPETPSEAPPRESIEVRVFAFFD